MTALRNIIMTILIIFSMNTNINAQDTIRMDSKVISLPLYGTIIYNDDKDTLYNVFLISKERLMLLIKAEKQNKVYSELILKYGNLSELDVMIIDTLKNQIVVLKQVNSTYKLAFIEKENEIDQLNKLVSEVRNESSLNKEKYDKSEQENKRLEKKIKRLKVFNNILITTTSSLALTIVIISLL